MTTRVAFLLLTASACVHIASTLKIGAFNVQVFGPTKFSNSAVVATLSKVGGEGAKMNEIKLISCRSSVAMISYLFRKFEMQLRSSFTHLWIS